MPKISAICLSDLHLGSETSILTAIDGKELISDIDRDSPVLVSLVQCLKSIVDHHDGGANPRLVLAGDALEMALATTNVAATVFTRFTQLLFDEISVPVDRTLVFVPGNHDHHLWETAREHQYASYISEPETTMPLGHVPWHATHLFPWREELGVANRDVESDLLKTLLGFTGVGGEASVLTMYPNLGIRGTGDGNRCTVVHHGHFTESIYHLMTELRSIVFPRRKRRPDQIWDVEAENYAWIDFLWGTLGRSGEVGKDMELVYNMLKSGKATRRLIGNLAWSIPGLFKCPWWLRWLAGLPIWIVLIILARRIGGMERGDPSFPLSGDSRRRLDRYVSRYVRGQLDREYENGLPKHLNFVFGHTHKPFEEIGAVEGFDVPVHIYNTGGWVVDTIETAPNQGGAIVVIDEDGHAASIRMYNQSDDPASYRVRVERADRGGASPNPLYEQLSECIDPDRPPWSDFSRLAEKAVTARHDYMEKVIKRAGG